MRYQWSNDDLHTSIRVFLALFKIFIKTKVHDNHFRITNFPCLYTAAPYVRLHGTMDSRYISVEYNTLSHGDQQSQCLNFDHTLNSQRHPLHRPGVSFVSYLQIDDRGISRVYCIDWDKPSLISPMSRHDKESINISAFWQDDMQSGHCTTSRN